MKRRILSCVICFLMVLTLLPTAALAEESYSMDFTQTSAQGWAGGVIPADADASGTGWYWDYGAKTLTLGYNNTAFSFTTSANRAVKLPAGATVELVSGTVNTLTGGSYGIYADGELTFSGSGKLTATAGASVESAGIYANGAVTVLESADITANGGLSTVNESYGLFAAGSVTMSDSSKLAANACSGSDICYGLRAAGVTLTDSAKLNSTGGNALSGSYGIYSSDSVTAEDSSELRAIGGTISTQNGAHGVGIYCTLTVTVKDSALIDGRSGFSYGIDTANTNSVHYEGGTLIANGASGQAALSSAPVITDAPGFFVWRTASDGGCETKNTFNASQFAAQNYAELLNIADFSLYLSSSGLIYKNDLNGENITPAFTGLLSFNVASGKWIMNGLDFKTSAAIVMTIEQTSGSNALLELSGSNSLMSSHSGPNPSIGITSAAALVVSGTGSLSISPGKNENLSAGISVNGFTLESGALDIDVAPGRQNIEARRGVDSNSGNMVISGGSLTVDVAGSITIGLKTTGSLEISGGSTEITTSGVAIMASPDNGTSKTMSFTGGMAEASGRYIAVGAAKESAQYLPTATADDINNNSAADRRYMLIEPKGAISVDPAVLDFGNVPVGTTPSKTVTITNNGTLPVSINGYVIPPAACYVLVHPLPQIVPAGGTATLTLMLNSTAATVMGQKPTETYTVKGSKTEEATITINCNVVNACSITYDANGGAGSMANDTVAEGSPFTMPGCGFTAPAGMRFKEWAIDSADGTKVAAGAEHTFSADTTVYAVWEPESISYLITEGENGTWTKGSKGGLRVTSNGDYNSFTGVAVDGAPISRDKYTAESGSTIVTLNASYLESLTVGQHTLRINFTNGYAETSFTIRSNPNTGDSSLIWLWLGIAAMAMAGLAACAVIFRGRRQPH